MAALATMEVSHRIRARGALGGWMFTACPFATFRATRALRAWPHAGHLGRGVAHVLDVLRGWAGGAGGVSYGILYLYLYFYLSVVEANRALEMRRHY